MRTGLYKRLSNEELVELYKAGESDAFEALLKNTEGLRATLAQRFQIHSLSIIVLRSRLSCIELG